MQSMESLADESDEPAVVDRAAALREYAETIRDYVTGKDSNPTMTAKIVAADFADKNFSGTDVINIHLEAMKHLVRGLDHSQARKVNAKSRELVLAIIIHVADSYVKRPAGG